MVDVCYYYLVELARCGTLVKAEMLVTCNRRTFTYLIVFSNMETKSICKIHQWSKS